MIVTRCGANYGVHILGLWREIWFQKVWIRSLVCWTQEARAQVGMRDLVLRRGRWFEKVRFATCCARFERHELGLVWLG